MIVGGDYYARARDFVRSSLQENYRVDSETDFLECDFSYAGSSTISRRIDTMSYTFSIYKTVVSYKI